MCKIKSYLFINRTEIGILRASNRMSREFEMSCDIVSRDV